MTQPAKGRSEKAVLFTGGFSSFSVNDISKAKQFYGDTLGLDVADEQEGALRLENPSGGFLFVYPKDDHKPATFTVFNLQVDDVSNAVDDLANRGIEFLQYDDAIKTDEKGIFWGLKDGHSPNIAWFEDPAGNILSVIEDQSG